MQIQSNECKFWQLKRPTVENIVKSLKAEPRKQGRRRRRKREYTDGVIDSTESVSLQAQRYMLAVSMQRLNKIKDREVLCLYDVGEAMDREEDFNRLDEIDFTSRRKLSVRKNDLSRKRPTSVLNRKLSMPMKEIQKVDFTHSLEQQIDKERDLDIRLFSALERRFGSLDETLFSSSQFPGRTYRFLAERSARRLQVHWRSHLSREYNKQSQAAQKIQTLIRKTNARRVWKALLRDAYLFDSKSRMFLSKNRLRKMLVTFRGWKRLVEREKVVQKKLRQIQAASVGKSFYAWKHEYRLAADSKRMKVIIIKARLCNNLLTAAFREWKSMCQAKV